jgi:hypothetical protein
MSEAEKVSPWETYSWVRFAATVAGLTASAAATSAAVVFVFVMTPLAPMSL